MTTQEAIETPCALTSPLALQSDPMLSPEHIAAMTSLYGFESAPTNTARVLVLGCGRGDSLLPFALTNPDAQVIGIDIDTGIIQQGELLRQTAGAHNVQLGALSLNQLVELEVGQQDYIFVGAIWPIWTITAGRSFSAGAVNGWLITACWQFAGHATQVRAMMKP